jgi:hypothetical protein
MPFDPNLDKKLFSESIDFDNTRITVSVFSYNEGTPKLQIVRENKTKDNYRFTKLGRLTKEEAKAIIPLIDKALGSM